MRLLLVHANRAREPFPVPPLGLVCVAAAARRSGHDVRLADLAFGDWPRLLAAELAAFRPQAVGLGLRNVDNALREHYVSYLPHHAALSRALRQAGVPLIVGGPGFSLFPEALLDYLQADYGVVGEGEAALPALLARLAAGEALDAVGAIPGLVWRAEGKVHRSPPRPCPDLNALAPPEHGLVNYAAYEAEAGFAAVQTKRGCPRGCIYCSYPRLEGRQYRLRRPRAVGEELERLAASGVRYVFFADSIFNAPATHAELVCEEIIRRGLKLGWMAYVNPRGLSGELARLMRRAGCLGAELGVDSASEPMIERLGKGFTQADIVGASRALGEAGVPQALYCLLGGPGECRATIREGLTLLRRHTRPQFVAVNVGLRVFPGTPLAELAGAHAPRDPLAPHFYLSPEVDAAALDDLFRLCAESPCFATPRDFERPLTRALLWAMVRLRVRPFWRHAWLNGWSRRLPWGRP